MTCHMLNPSNPLGTDDRFHNIGVSARKQNFEELADKALKAVHAKEGKEGTRPSTGSAIETNLSELGRFLVTKNRSDIGSFKTFQLRNIGITGRTCTTARCRRSRRDRPLQPRRRGEPVPRRRHRAARAHRPRDREPRRVPPDARPDKRFAAEQRTETARQRAVAAKQRPFREERARVRKTLPFESG
jgi:cytochrome c peroxidase